MGALVVKVTFQTIVYIPEDAQVLSEQFDEFGQIYIPVQSPPQTRYRGTFLKIKFHFGTCSTFVWYSFQGTQAPHGHLCPLPPHKHPGSAQKQVTHQKWGATVKQSLTSTPTHLAGDKGHAGVLISTCGTLDHFLCETPFVGMNRSVSIQETSTWPCSPWCSAR